MPINQQIAYTLTRSIVSNGHLITRNMHMRMHTMFYWLGEQGAGGLGTNKSGQSSKSKNYACGGPLGFREL